MTSMRAGLVDCVGYTMASSRFDVSTPFTTSRMSGMAWSRTARYRKSSMLPLASSAVNLAQRELFGANPLAFNDGMVRARSIISTNDFGYPAGVSFKYPAICGANSGKRTAAYHASLASSIHFGKRTSTMVAPPLRMAWSADSMIQSTSALVPVKSRAIPMRAPFSAFGCRYFV